MRRNRRSYAYVISARLGDAMATHILMVWAATYVATGDGARKLAKVRLVQADRHAENVEAFATRLEELYDAIDDGRGIDWDFMGGEAPEMYGLGCVVDHSRNSAFQRIMNDHRFNPELALLLNGGTFNDWAPNRLDVLIPREDLVNDLGVELAARRVSLSPEGNIPVSDITEALEGFQRRLTARQIDTTVVVETDYRDDVALCLSLGVFWSHYRPPISENWAIVQSEAGAGRIPYAGAVI